MCGNLYIIYINVFLYMCKCDISLDMDIIDIYVNRWILDKDNLNIYVESYRL